MGSVAICRFWLCCLLFYTCDSHPHLCILICASSSVHAASPTFPVPLPPPPPPSPSPPKSPPPFPPPRELS
eukprot:387526-Pelagomonas_calceolata.AAC.2